MVLFDIVIFTIVIMLGIKGFMNGFVKEVFGLIGIAGGFIIASKYYHITGMYINDNLINIKNKSAIDLVGFIITFISFWVICIFLGFLFNKILKISALGYVDRILGVLISSLKFLVMISIVLYLLCQIEFVKNKLNNWLENSISYHLMLNIGENILKYLPKNEKQKIIKYSKIDKNFSKNKEKIVNLDVNLSKIHLNNMEKKLDYMNNLIKGN